MCNRSHTYTVEVVGRRARYAGTADGAVRALLGIDLNAGHEQGAEAVLNAAGLDALDTTELEELCDRFGVVA